jgi:peptidoglycan/LPS O-acetylase OafA/YrhL
LDIFQQKRNVPSTFLPGIHGLRAIAFLMVTMFHLHYVGELAFPAGAQVIAAQFGFGVHLFFVISGFSLICSTEVTDANNQWIREYSLKRFFRIAPLFYAMLAFYFLFWPGTSSFRTLLVSAVFIFNFIPGKHEGVVAASWTIGVEMIFYALLPLIFLFVRSMKGFAILCAVALAVSYEGRYLLESVNGLPTYYAHMAFISSIGIFALGLLAGSIFISTRARWQSSALPSAKQITIKWLLIIATLLSTAILLSPVERLITVQGQPHILLWGVVFAISASWQALFPSRAIANKAFVWIGERSYSGYLLHPIVIILMRPINHHIYQTFEASIGAYAFFVCSAITIAIVLLLSAVTYKLIERPGIEYGRRLILRNRSSMSLPAQAS